MTQPTTLTRSLQASPAAAYRAFATAAGLASWCAEAADIDARPGGHLFLSSEGGVLIAGRCTAVEVDRLLAWELLAPVRGVMRVEITPLAEGISAAISLAGDGPLDELQAYWARALDNLAAVLETGLDRRVYDRPMLGILISGLLDADSRARLETPADHGIVIGGTVAGMGAAAMGLREGDVLVALNGVALKDYHALHEALAGLKAGDQAAATWYRGSDRVQSEMTLSGRPIPFVPETAAELADYVDGIYQRLDAELAEILEGVTEAAAEYRPSEKEWSSKEILAHVITTERAVQLWIANAVEGKRFENWASNKSMLVKSIVDVAPELDEIVAELHRAEGQTVSMLRRLPPEIANFRGPYVNLVTTLGDHGMPVHTRMHYETIRSLVAEAARALVRG